LQYGGVTLKAQQCASLQRLYLSGLYLLHLLCRAGYNLVHNFQHRIL
jgi:hypothetical protein